MVRTHGRQPTALIEPISKHLPWIKLRRGVATELKMATSSAEVSDIFALNMNTNYKLAIICFSYSTQSQSNQVCSSNSQSSGLFYTLFKKKMPHFRLQAPSGRCHQPIQNKYTVLLTAINHSNTKICLTFFLQFILSEFGVSDACQNDTVGVFSLTKDEGLTDAKSKT